ncbi:hypothetical protein D3C72_2178780 [compost metagenome]
MWDTKAGCIHDFAVDFVADALETLLELFVIRLWSRLELEQMVFLARMRDLHPGHIFKNND